MVHDNYYNNYLKKVGTGHHNFIYTITVWVTWSLLGFTDQQWANYCLGDDLVKTWTGVEIPEPLPPKEFLPTHPNLPVLSSYRGKLPQSYWDKWIKRTYQSLLPVKSWISPKELKSIAEEIGYPTSDAQLKRVLERLAHGADIGCRGNGRLPTRSKNSASAYQYGERVADALQSWVTEGLCFGPLSEE